MEAVDFNKVIEVYTKNKLFELSLNRLGFVNSNKNNCNNFMLYILTKVKGFYDNENNFSSLKNNINELYNYII